MKEVVEKVANTAHVGVLLEDVSQGHEHWLKCEIECFEPSEHFSFGDAEIFGLGREDRLEHVQNFVVVDATECEAIRAFFGVGTTVNGEIRLPETKERATVFEANKFEFLLVFHWANWLFSREIYAGFLL